MKSQFTFKDLILMFMDGSTEGMSSTGTLKICGDKLIHYKTVIAERFGNGIIVNVSRYSLATGKLQKQILELVPDDVKIIVKKVPVDYNGSLIGFVESEK